MIHIVKLEGTTECLREEIIEMPTGMIEKKEKISELTYCEA